MCGPFLTVTSRRRGLIRFGKRLQGPCHAALRVVLGVAQCFDGIQAVAQAARQIQRSGTEIVCISLGTEVAVIVDGKDSYYCPAPKVRIYSTVGSGDAMVAGMVMASLLWRSVEELLRFGVICGSATASHPGTELFTRAEVEEVEYELELRGLAI